MKSWEQCLKDAGVDIRNLPYHEQIALLNAANEYLRENDRLTEAMPALKLLIERVEEFNLRSYFPASYRILTDLIRKQNH